MSSLGLVSCLSAVLVLGGPQASVDGVGTPETAEPEERAGRLYEQGRERYLRGDYEDAITSFATAYDLSGDPNLLFNIASAYDRLDAFAMAIDYLRRFREVAPPELQPEIDAQIEGLTHRQAAVAAQPKGAGHQGASAPSSSSRAQERSMTIGAITMGALGAAGLGVGAGLGAAALAASREAERHCAEPAGQCEEAAQSPLERSRSFAIGADVAFVFGGTALVAFAALLGAQFARDRRRRSDARRARVGVWGPGVAVSGSF